MIKNLNLHLCIFLLLSLANVGHAGFFDLFKRKSKKSKEVQVNEPLLESPTMGKWELFTSDSGVSAMHIQIMPSNNAIIFDAASLGPSNIKLPPNNCRAIPPNVTDCFAHGVVLDTNTAKVRVLKVMSDPWCSSGGLAPDGTLINTGGWFDGEKSVRYIGDCETCDFRESATKLSEIRWYGTQVQLATGQYIVLGGRRAFNYEFVAPEGKASPGKIDLPFLLTTTDMYENNLYPFVHLAPDGHLFIFANNKSIMLDPIKNKIVRKYPDLPGGARNYPGSGSSALLPIKLKRGQKDAPDLEVLICGGGQVASFGKAERESVFIPALDTCGRMKLMQRNAEWEMERMPSPRIMGDMLILPNGLLLMINGAQRGSSGWTYADEPNLTPVLYRPESPKGQRFRNLQPTNIPRMYHSSSALLQCGKILVAGSNTNPSYQFNAKFPTEVRVEKFAPPYLDTEMDQYRPTVNAMMVPKKACYGADLIIPLNLGQQNVKAEEMTVGFYKPPFTTHGYSMNQRLLELAVTDLTPGLTDEWTLVAQAPLKPTLAPPGFYLMFVSYRGVPGAGSWIHLI
ncbi:hypothetical protein V2J09_017857 [Rumex salicifolius]